MTISNPRVLIVDDEPLLGRALAFALEGAESRIACDGAQALSALGESAFDIVVSDIHLPDISGLELHEQAVARSPALARRFVFMTGGAPSGQLLGQLEATGCPCLQKPFGIQELGAVISLVMKDHVRG